MSELPLKSFEFETILLEAVDWGLSSPGETSKYAMYFHLERSFGVKKEEIPYKVVAFAGAVEEIFGFGAGFLENLILERLCEEVGEHFNWDISNDSEFVRCVAKARQVFRRREEHARAGDISERGDVLVKKRALSMPNVCRNLHRGR